jgi:uncharacterized membrane protein affecting hemolysin expression
MVTIEDFKQYLIESGNYTEQELFQLFAIMEGIHIANRASVEKDTEEVPIAVSDHGKNKNLWLLIIASLSGIILALIIIYFNRRRNKGNRKNKF